MVHLPGAGRVVRLNAKASPLLGRRSAASKRRLRWAAAVPPPQSAGFGRGRRTLGTGPTLRDDLLSLLRAVARPCATWALSPGYDGLRKRTDHGFDYATDPKLAKDAVLPPWGSSGTWRCRAREMRHGRRSERRPPWRQNGGPVRSRCFQPYDQRHPPRTREKNPKNGPLYKDAPRAWRSGARKAWARAAASSADAASAIAATSAYRHARCG